MKRGNLYHQNVVVVSLMFPDCGFQAVGKYLLLDLQKMFSGKFPDCSVLHNPVEKFAARP
ncbi:hypothetical protein DAPPUDRAFT_312635 [Daphnia pulex]|uniref:Uncharacterized protein n=1 Tax=Daphnia pulex TaxID=6669 RepID=E9FZR7_DAPPU|nr:hypothetical protein DAPPUDRAFT_312635 [Daphnia pulex]|eukprot:EFX87218.1 hypothetical protein DAPPUDRAFT_312635 [Daphnia pulex]